MTWLIHRVFVLIQNNPIVLAEFINTVAWSTRSNCERICWNTLPSGKDSIICMYTYAETNLALSLLWWHCEGIIFSPVFIGITTTLVEVYRYVYTKKPFPSLPISNECQYNGLHVGMEVQSTTKVIFLFSRKPFSGIIYSMVGPGHLARAGDG